MIKRHEFKDEEDNDTLVAFEDGTKTCLYWRRTASITYVYTNLTFTDALKFAEKKIVTQTTFDSSPEEMADYEKIAAEHHNQIGKDGTYK